MAALKERIWQTQVHTELDGIYAHLNGLSRDDFAYILDTFPIVRRNDEARWGEFRTKRLVLEAYDRYRGLTASGQPAAVSKATAAP